jgi:hypothetical protein
LFQEEYSKEGTETMSTTHHPSNHKRKHKRPTIPHRFEMLLHIVLVMVYVVLYNTADANFAIILKFVPPVFQ